jgi:hypothetical protein
MYLGGNMNKWLILIITFSFLSCVKNTNNDPVKEQADTQSRSQMEAENNNQRLWAQKMEDDLNEVKKFLQGVSGSFLGHVEIENIDFLIKLELISNMPIIFSDRVRTLDEITYELSNIALNINVKLENPRVSNSAVSCIVENYKPDTVKGIVQILSQSCKNIFKLYLSNGNDPSSDDILIEDSIKIAKEVSMGALQRVNYFSGTFESSVSTHEYRFTLKRIE